MPDLPLNPEDNSLIPVEIKPSFINNDCEKNWIYVNNSNQEIVYSWNPLRICKIDEDAKVLYHVKTVETPKIFKHVRGSTNGFCYNNEFWFIGHIVSYERPRHYYHIFSIFDENMNLLRYSAPFKFTNQCIEYCLGLVVEENRIICTYSDWDRTTVIGVYDKTYIDELISYTA